MSDTKNWWKIMGGGVTVLTYIAPEYADGDGAYAVMKKLQKVFGDKLCSYQKWDDEHDKLEDFDTILRVHYNAWGTRMIDAYLFEYDRKTETLTVDRQQPRKVVRDWEYTYSWKVNIVKCIGGWNGLRRHLMDWQNFSLHEFDILHTKQLIEIERNAGGGIAELLGETA